MSTKDETENTVLKDERIKEAAKLEESNAVVTTDSQTVVNTSQSLKAGFKTNAQLAEENKRALAKSKGEKLVTVSIPSVLQSKLGPNQFISVNGVSVTIPVDGEDHKIPATHAAHLKEYLKQLN